MSLADNANTTMRVLVFLTSFASAAAAAPRSPITHNAEWTVEPKPRAGVLLNPGKGWYVLGETQVAP